jgi:hypothetical protein
MAKTKSDDKLLVPGDFIVHEHSQTYCRESAKIVNDSTTAGTVSDGLATKEDVTGQPVKKLVADTSGDDWKFASADDVAAGDVDGFLVDGEPVSELIGDGITDWEYPILARGPAIINEGRVPATDVYGSVIDKTKYLEAALALNITSKPVPTKTSTQTT